jgi:LCP family protein required for cell wall assembly
MPLHRFQYYQPQRLDGQAVLSAEPRAEAPLKTAKKTKARAGKIAVRLLLVLLLAIVSGISWIIWQFAQDTTKVFGGSPGGNLIAMMEPTQLKGHSRGRVNVLLVGNSVDDPGHPAADLTDSIMILSVSTTDKSAVLLSIPRDLWVDIPDNGHEKINAVYPYGNIDKFSEPGYPLGGIGLLEKVIKHNLGIPLDYYVLINYSAVRGAVNAVGGIEVAINSTDPRGLYDPNIQAADGGPLRLPNGVQQLDGQTALNLVRARGTPAPDGRVGYGFPRSDFNRTIHQRQVLLALKDKASDISVVANPWRLGRLFDAVGNNVQTDLEINEARRLGLMLRGISNSDMQTHSFAGNGVNLLTGYVGPGGQTALIPAAGLDNFSEIQAAIRKWLATSSGR